MLRNWREFIIFMWNLLYDKMVYRELLIEMDEKRKKAFEEEMKENCDNFVKETQKKKYILSCCSLCCPSKKDYEYKNEWSKSDGFFCSQLVAAAYLKCGIMKLNKGSNYYLPGNFAQSKDSLELVDGFSLGPEIIIDFTV
jgi:hypothetical protein